LVGGRLRWGDLPGVHPGAGLDLESELPPEASVQLRQPGLHLQRGANGSQRVILMGHRNTEDAHNRVADELLHRSTVSLEDAPHRGEVPADRLAPGLGIQALSQRG
jgi:hypothetical protein